MLHRSELRIMHLIRVTEERELYAVREQLHRYPQAVAAILQTAANVRRPVDALNSEHVQSLC